MHLRYDVMDQLVEARDASDGSLLAIHTYDAEGRRTRVETEASSREIITAPALGGLEWTHAVIDSTNDELLAGYVLSTDGPLLRHDASGEKLYYLSDAVGTVIGLINEAGELLSCAVSSAAQEKSLAGCSMSFVIVGPSLDLSRAQLQHRLRPVQGLNLSLFVDREHHGVGRRIHVEPHDIHYFFGEVRIVADLESLDPVRLEIRSCPDLADLPFGDLGIFGHQKAIDAFLLESAAPAANGFGLRIELLGDGFGGHAVGAEQSDLGAKREAPRGLGCRGRLYPPFGLKTT